MKINKTAVESAKNVDLVALAKSNGVDMQKQGSEFFGLCPFHSEDSPSFSINPESNRYYCFGCGEGKDGGDAIEFLQHIKSCSFTEAVSELLGGSAASDGGPVKAHQPSPEKKPTWEPLPTADEAPDAPGVFHKKQAGKWLDLTVTTRWAYRDAAGSLIGYVCRFDLPDGGKDVIPQVWAANTETGECSWRWLSFAKPRPLYGLERLAAHPKAQVIIVEGEKAADAARHRAKIANIKESMLVVCAWPGGSKAVKHIDWSPLADRKVALWPDADQKPYPDSHPMAGIRMPMIEQPGMSAMLDVWGHIADLARGVKIVLPPDGVPDGWDLADDDPVDFDFRSYLASAANEPESILQENNPEIPVAPLEDFDARGDDELDAEGEDAINSRGYFRILGYDHGTYYVLQEEGRQIHSLTKSDFTDSGMVELAPPEWWQRHFPTEKGGISKTMAFNWFVRRARAMGIYDPSRMRGRGAWIDNGRVVVHIGRWLYVDGQRTDPTKIASQYVYELDRSLPDLSGTALTPDEGKSLFDLARMFRWAKPANAALLCGWAMLAPLCGAIKWRPHIWITGGAGSGKAQPHSANVLTPTGWRAMGDLKAGDCVSTPDNGFGRIRGVYPQGEVPVFKITFADGRTTRATGDHLWKVRVKHAWRIRTTDEMRGILSRDTRASVNLAVPIADPMTVRNGGAAQTLLMHPYALGVMLGDGCLRHKAGLNLTCFDPEIVDRARACLEGSDFNFYDTSVKGRYRFGDLARYGRNVRETIKELRLLNCSSDTKFIPRAYLDASVEDRWELLKGLMDTDGHAGSAGSMSYSTVSDQLCRGVVELVRSLGGIASISERVPHYTHNGELREGRLAYIVNIRMNDPSKAFSVPRKVERMSGKRQYDDCLYLGVTSIEADGFEACSCIAIDHPDRLYVTDDFVVTHNTTVLDDFLAYIVGDWGLFAQGNSTEAGIRQTLRKDARPVLIDETESNEERDKARVQGIIGMIRQASSESGAMTFKGTTFGSSMHFQIRSMFALSSIQVALKQQADIERLSVLALRPKMEETGMAGADNWARISAELTKLHADEELPSRLHRRCVDMLPIVTQNIRTFGRAGAEKWGNQRDGDQYGTLMAGCWSLLSDEVASLDQARAMLDAYEWDDHLDHAGNDEAKMALSDLMGQQIRVMPSLNISVYEMVRFVAGKGTDVEIDMPLPDVVGVLARYGVRVDNEAHMIAVANRLPPPMADLIAKTQFGADLKGQIGRLKGAKRSEKAMRFAGHVGRATLIPFDHLFASDEAESLPIELNSPF
jgi:hypothetical protein